MWNRWSTTQHYSSRPGCPASRAAAAVKWDCTCNSSSRAQPGFMLSGSAAVVPVLVPGSHWCQGAQSEVVCHQPHSATHLPSHHHWCSVPSLQCWAPSAVSHVSALPCPLSTAMSLPSAEKSLPCCRTCKAETGTSSTDTGRTPEVVPPSNVNNNTISNQ